MPFLVYQSLFDLTRPEIRFNLPAAGPALTRARRTAWSEHNSLMLGGRLRLPLNNVLQNMEASKWMPTAKVVRVSR